METVCFSTARINTQNKVAATASSLSFKRQLLILVDWTPFVPCLPVAHNTGYLPTCLGRRDMLIWTRDALYLQGLTPVSLHFQSVRGNTHTRPSLQERWISFSPAHRRLLETVLLRSDMNHTHVGFCAMWAHHWDILLQCHNPKRFTLILTISNICLILILTVIWP